ALSLQLTSEERQHLQKRYTDNAQAYQLYLRARYYGGQKSKEGVLRAEELLKQALVLDSRYALAYVELAGVWSLKADLGISPIAEVALKAREMAHKAVELD